MIEGQHNPELPPVPEIQDPYIESLLEAGLSLDDILLCLEEIADHYIKKISRAKLTETDQNRLRALETVQEGAIEMKNPDKNLQKDLILGSVDILVHAGVPLSLLRVDTFKRLNDDLKHRKQKIEEEQGESIEEARHQLSREIAEYDESKFWEEAERRSKLKDETK